MTAKNATKNATTPKEVNSVAPKKRPDWQAIERDFRTDKFTLRELEDKHGPNCGTISRRAKKEGWTKDLSSAIKQATNAKLINAVLEDQCINAQQNTTETVLAAAEINKDVILGHRKGLSRLTAIKATLLGQIEQAVENMADLSEVIAMVRNEDENGTDRANDALRKSMGRSALVDDLKKLADVDEKVRKGEREAFGLNDETPPEKSPLDSLLKAICSGNNSAFGVVQNDPDHDED